MCNYPLLTRTCCSLGPLSPPNLPSHLPPSFQTDPSILTLCPRATRSRITNLWRPCANRTPHLYANTTFSSYPVLCPTCEERFVGLYLSELPATEERLQAVMGRTGGSEKLDGKRKRNVLGDALEFYQAAVGKVWEGLFYDRVKAAVERWVGEVRRASEEMLGSVDGVLVVPEGGRVVFRYEEVLGEEEVVRARGLAREDAEAVVRAWVRLEVAEMEMGRTGARRSGCDREGLEREVEAARGELRRLYGEWGLVPEL